MSSSDIRDGQVTLYRETEMLMKTGNGNHFAFPCVAKNVEIINLKERAALVKKVNSGGTRKKLKSCRNHCHENIIIKDMDNLDFPVF